MAKETFFWYDLETFGLDPRWDRIAQFAGQRTDLNLNPIGDPVVLYNRLTPDYLPTPESVILTGITPQLVNSKGLREIDFITRVNRELSVPGTIAGGFNSIRFDDEMVRNTLYRNLFNPYEREWKNGCSRWDIIDLVRATHDLRPDGIAWPPLNEKNHLSIKLTQLTEANGISHEHAHDALADVFATIAVAKLIKEKQPRIFDYFLKRRSSASLKNIVTAPFGKPLLHVNPIFTTDKGFSRLITPITSSRTNSNAFICFDLSQDPTPLLDPSNEDLMATKGILQVALNKCPFLAEADKLLTDEIAARIGIDKGLAMTRYNLIRRDLNLPNRLAKADEKLKESYQDVSDVDFRIYSGSFFQDSDYRLFQTVRETPPQNLLSIKPEFKDPRGPAMLNRFIGRNYPEVMGPKLAKQWQLFCRERIQSPPGDVKNNLEQYERRIEDGLASEETTDGERKLYLSLKDYGEELKKKLGF